MRHLKLAIATAALALVAFGTAVAKDKLHVQGKPEKYNPGDIYCYAVWHDDDGWHLRCTTKKKEHHFKGTIVIKGGKFGDTKLVKGERKDRYRIGPERHKMEFDFTTDEAEDGIDFHAGKEADSIEWDLEIGGEKGGVKKQPDHVFVGKNGEHPDSIPFTTVAHPKAQR